MGAVKRSPNIPRQDQGRFARISKAQWAELYRDLYAQTHGDENVAEYMGDAESRLAILKVAGISR